MWIEGVLALLLGSSPATPAWKVDVPGGVRQMALSAGDDCIVVTGEASVTVLDLDGTVRWERRFADLGRWTRVHAAAAPSGCGWVVLLGDPSYRFVWVVHRDGRGQYLRTRGTPLAASVSRRGDRVAVGTGAGYVYIFDPAITKVVSSKVGCGVFGLELSEETERVIITDGCVGTLDAAGGASWAPGWWERLAASRDLRWFVVSREAPHGPSIGTGALLDSTGVVIWDWAGNSPRLAMAPDGSFYALIDHGCPPEHLCNDNAIEDGLRLFRIDGTAINAGPPGPGDEIVRVASDSKSLLVADWDGPLTWVSNLGKTLGALELQAPAHIVAATGDLRWVIAAGGSTVQGYRRPEGRGESAP